MNIPPDVNTRAEAMWRIISQHVDFKKKSVIDLGCGHGEMLWRAYVAGAKEVYGVDDIVKLNVWDLHNEIGSIYVSEANIHDMINEKWFIPPHKECDIAMCFSVLPYLDDIPATLNWMAENFQLCLIEAQYEPEPYNIGVKGDGEMFTLMRDNGFEIAVNLGQTYVEIRDTHRTLWACAKERIRYD